MGHSSFMLELKLSCLCIKPIVAKHLTVRSTVLLAENIMEKNTNMLRALMELMPYWGSWEGPKIKNVGDHKLYLTWWKQQASLKRRH